MKVLMFGWEFPPFISGGLGTVCQALTRHLTQQGIEILFVMPKAQDTQKIKTDKFELRGADQIPITKTLGQLYKSLSDKTINVLEVDSLLEPYSNETSYLARFKNATDKINFLKAIQQSKFLGNLEFHGGYGRDLINEVSRYAVIGSLLGLQEQFDVIHAHDWMSFPAGVEAKRTSGKHLICHVHATEFDRTGGNPNHDIYQIEKYGLEMADRIIAVSQRTKDTIVHNYGIHPDKIAVVYNAVSKEKQLERCQIKKGFKEKIVLFLGRVTLQKGPDYFVEAAKLVLKKLDNVRFVMAGSGDMLNRLIERVAYYRIQDKFHFTGFLHGKEVEEMFALSDVYVMPSVSEPFGVTPFEAMLYHVPVIISKQSGISEILHHAIKVDFWDVQKLASNIIEVLTNETLSQYLIEEGGKELDQISWDSAAQKVIHHYNQVVAV